MPMPLNQQRFAQWSSDNLGPRCLIPLFIMMIYHWKNQQRFNKGQDGHLLTLLWQQDVSLGWVKLHCLQRRALKIFCYETNFVVYLTKLIQGQYHGPLPCFTMDIWKYKFNRHQPTIFIDKLVLSVLSHREVVSVDMSHEGRQMYSKTSLDQN